MSEYEIFNDEEQIKIEPEKKAKPVKIKVEKEKKECVCCNFFKEVFSLALLPLTLAIIGIFFALFAQFTPMVVLSAASAIASACFFFIGFACAFAGLILEVVDMVKNKKFVFNIKLLIIILAFFVLCI